ncbi:MAG: alpha/beta hydrolase, partial [Anaerolineae bacterium]|nr:alpha/beta hydrolase [Anaerolineae bacterium]
MKTRKMSVWKMLSGMALVFVVLLTGYASASAKDLASVGLSVEAPAARQAAQVRTATDAVSDEPVTLPDTVVRVFRSKITGQKYRIYVSLPMGYSAEAAGPEGYPVVYLVDGNWHFPTTTGIARFLRPSGELPDMIIVGIGYPTDDNAELEILRQTDLLPGVGADPFLGFIQEELMPYIDANYLTNPQDRTLAGHSYGGLFTLYALFTATDAFQRYVALSPALFYHPDWNGERLIFDLEQEYAAQNDALPVELFLSVGETEL